MGRIPYEFSQVVLNQNDKVRRRRLDKRDNFGENILYLKLLTSKVTLW